MKLSQVINFGAGALCTLLLMLQFAFRDLDNGARWTTPALPEQLQFAGEGVPLERWDVREKFDKEYKKYKKAKSNNGKHLGWEKGKGNPHRTGGKVKKNKN